MKELVFIYGKNPKLSLAEIACFLESQNIDFEIKESTKEFVVTKVSKIPHDTEKLGGILKVAEVLISFQPQYLRKEIENINFSKIFRGFPEKTVFSVSTYGFQDCGFFSAFLKRKMKAEGMKPGYRKNKLIHKKVMKKEVVEFLICLGKKFYLARTLFIHDPFEFRKRDMKRPFQRSIFSIPPRLCRIMINLSGVKKGVLLDPFCGIGSILQEALLMGFDIRGIDKDRRCVERCLGNLKWIKKEYGIKLSLENKIKKGDSTRLSEYFKKGSIDIIVTEPYLGPPLKRSPKFKEAKRIITNLTPLYRNSLVEMLKVLKKKGVIVMVSPFFKTERGLVRLEVEKLVNELNAKIINPLEGYGIRYFPLRDYEKRHKTRREISIIKPL